MRGYKQVTGATADCGPTALRIAD